MKKKLMLTALLIGLMSIGTVYGAFLTYKGFVEIYGTKYPTGIIELDTMPIAPIEGLEAREDYLGDIRVWTYSDKTQLVLQLVQLSHIVTNFRSFTVKVKLDLDIVLSVDLTGSMMPYMDTVREELKRLVGVLYMMNLGQVQVAIVGYKDYPDETIVCPWTHDPEEAMQWIDDHLYAMTGAGIPQSHYLGFQEALALFEAKPESWVHDRVVVHVGDSEPGFDDMFEFAPDGPTVRSVLALAEAGIKVHSVLCGPDEVPENAIYRWYADVTGGHFVLGADRIVPGVTRDPTWIVKLTPVTPFDSFRMPLRSSEPTRQEGFYTFHIYVDFWCKAVPWHEFFLTELTAHLEKAEIPPYFPPPEFPEEVPPAGVSLSISPVSVTIPEEVRFDWTITSPPELNPHYAELYLEAPGGGIIPLATYNSFPPWAGSHVWTSTLPTGTWTVYMDYYYDYLGTPLSIGTSGTFEVGEMI